MEDKYEFIKQIGHGAYGVVCSATNKKNGEKVAIKKVIKAIIHDLNSQLTGSKCL